MCVCVCVCFQNFPKIKTTNKCHPPQTSIPSSRKEARNPLNRSIGRDIALLASLVACLKRYLFSLLWENNSISLLLLLQAPKLFNDTVQSQNDAISSPVCTVIFLFSLLRSDRFSHSSHTATYQSTSVSNLFSTTVTRTTKTRGHYLRAQSQGRHTIDRPEERGAERGSARRSSLKGRVSM